MVQQQSDGGYMVQFKLRKAVEEDIPSLVALFRETILEVYGQILSRDVLKPWAEGDRLREDIGILWHDIVVAENAGDITAAAARIDDLVALLWVHPAHQRKGMGSALLDAIETDMMESGHDMAKLECFSDNDKAIGFYRAKGWEPLREEVDEVAGASKVVMTKMLKK